MTRREQPKCPTLSRLQGSLIYLIPADMECALSCSAVGVSSLPLVLLHFLRNGDMLGKFILYWFVSFGSDLLLWTSLPDTSFHITTQLWDAALLPYRARHQTVTQYTPWVLQSTTNTRFGIHKVVLRLGTIRRSELECKRRKQNSKSLLIESNHILFSKKISYHLSFKSPHPILLLVWCR